MERLSRADWFTQLDIAHFSEVLENIAKLDDAHLIRFFVESKWLTCLADCLVDLATFINFVTNGYGCLIVRSITSRSDGVGRSSE